MIGIKIDFGLERSVINLRTHANAESVSRLQCVDDVEIVRKSFGEILPRVHGGICADETFLPGGLIFRIVPLKSRAIILAVIAEDGSTARQVAAITHELVPVKVSDLMPEMAEQRAISFAMETRACSLVTSSASASDIVITPESWPVMTFNVKRRSAGSAKKSKTSGSLAPLAIVGKGNPRLIRL
jgi:hypothetical protein